MIDYCCIISSRLKFLKDPFAFTFLKFCVQHGREDGRPGPSRVHDSAICVRKAGKIREKSRNEMARDRVSKNSTV